MRNYPKCKIIKIASLRGSTGCTYYREENRVQDYVLKHNPDLLMIGGISNRGDAEAVRSVIRQVRAKKPDTEVMLLTPVFGAMRDEHIRTFTREIDTTTSNFRFNMQRVAAEEKCAFFDMTGPWWAYIQESGKTYGWFMGDAVHANARGCQIIGRLLESWFKE
jgi:lysophospholipase L1-like esterase